MPSRPLLAKLCQLLFDEDYAELERVRARGCLHCGGPLHRADFARKSRGLEAEFERFFSTRLSLCCGREGCRHRRTPRSVRFFGRRLYFGALVVLLSALRGGLLPWRVAFLRRVFGVSRRTLERWRTWWREEFASSAFWRVSAGRFADGGGGREALPRSLWLAWRAHGFVPACFALLRFLAPLSSESITLDEGFI
jgi:hypothetical protein